MAMDTSFMVRDAQKDDVSFMEDMLFEAAAVSPVMRDLGKERALALPVNQKYIAGWGRSEDVGVLVVNANGLPLGAAWYRLFPADMPGYGFVAPTIPELTIGVCEIARGLGVGSALLRALMDRAKKQGYTALSLSVDRSNPALRLYERCGFRDAGVSDAQDSSVTLIATLS